MIGRAWETWIHKSVPRHNYSREAFFLASSQRTYITAFLGGPLEDLRKSLAVCCGKTANRDQELCWKYRFLARGQKQGPVAERAILGHSRYGCIFWREPKCRCLRWRTPRSKDTNPSGGWLFPFLLRVYLQMVWIHPGGAHSCCPGDDGLLPLGSMLAACPWVPAGSLYQLMVLAMTCQHLRKSNSFVTMAPYHQQPLSIALHQGALSLKQIPGEERAGLCSVLLWGTLQNLQIYEALWSHVTDALKMYKIVR